MAEQIPEKAMMGDSSAPPLVSEAELAAAFSGPGLHANKMYASNVSAGLRIAFMEQYGIKVAPQFRTAVLLSYPDAIALKNLLAKQLKEFEAIQAIEVEFDSDGRPVLKNNAK